MNVPQGEGKLDHYAVLGNPVDHSKSPLIHRIFAEQTAQRMVYSAILVPEYDALSDMLSEFHAHGGKGLNITSPYKQLAYSLVDTLSERAELAQAINVIKWDYQGNRYGDNTDGTGFIRDLVRNKGYTLFGKRVLVIGAGGAALGILGPLLHEHPAETVIVNRTEVHAKRRAKQFAKLGLIVADTIESVKGPFDLIINTTNSDFDFFQALSSSVFDANTFFYDLVYAECDTPFLIWAKHHGARHYCDGWGMLVEQAAQSFFLWRGVMPDTKMLLNITSPTSVY